MKTFPALLLTAALLTASLTAQAQNDLLTLPEDKPAVGINTPGISPDGKMVAFSYKGDLWTVPSSGGEAKRLTVHDAHDAYPKWSPDGKWIAFASNRYATAGINYDVFVIPAVGGEPKQITYHSGNDYPVGWSPDGKSILIQASRADLRWGIYQVDVSSLRVKTIVRDEADLRYAVFAPDGKTVYYDRMGGIGVWNRPRYHGSANAEIYSKNVETGKVSRVTDYDGQDLWPMIHPDGKRVFYASDQATPGKSNLVSAPVEGGKPTALTHHDRPVRFPTMAANGSAIAYTIDGDLYVESTSGGTPSKLTVFARSDSKINTVTRLNLTGNATEMEVSPDGKTLGLVIRGDIWTIPSDKGGDAVRLTNDTGNDHDFIWSTDSSKMAFVSDRRGNSDIFVLDVKTKEQKLLAGDDSEEINPHWSPDGKSVAYIRSGAQGGLYVAAADGSTPPKRIAESYGNNMYGVGISSHDWSPDSKWLTFARRDSIETTDVWVVKSDGSQKPTNITYFPGDNQRPLWTSDGKYIVFVSSRERTAGSDLWTIPLQRPRDDASTAPAGSLSTGSDVKIDFDEISRRAKRLTSQSVGGFDVAPDGKAVVFVSAQGGPPEYFSVPPAGGGVQRLTMTGEGTSTPRFSNDPNRFYVMAAGGGVKVITRGPGIWQGQPIAFSARMDLDRKAELAHIYSEFWRSVNAGFYDPKMHGVDWKSMRAIYERMLTGVDAKEEFAFFLLTPMAGELNASHMEISPATGERGPVSAELGMTFDESYTGPGLKLTSFLEDGPNDDGGAAKIKPGEYILSIDGEDVTWNEKMYVPLLDKANKTVDFLVNSTASKDGARVVKIKPIALDQWRTLEDKRRVREARNKVEKLSNGHVAYIYLRDMLPDSLKIFEQEMWGQAHDKDALILDIRGNRGGRIHDDVLAQLNRVNYAFTQPRDGERATQPYRLFAKPIIMLIDQDSVSDGEILPNGFRELKLGTIVGMPTPGYVIGTYGATLQDGTGYRIPMWGFYDKNGKNMENNGVKPDVMVELTPDDIAKGRDRQLETAVEMLKKKIASRN